jgi:hypothetical protein
MYGCHAFRSVDAREVPFAEAKNAAASLAGCFADDLVARYYLQISDCNRPLKPREEKLNLRIYECLTAAHCYNGLVISAGPCHDSVSLWLPPDSDWNWKTYWRSGLWLLWLRLGREGRTRFFGSWDKLEEGMTSIMGTRASTTWTLTDLGTRKSSRGQGYATKVMEYGLALVRICSPTRQILVVSPCTALGQLQSSSKRKRSSIYTYLTSA